MKRKTLICALFDVETTNSLSDVPSVHITVLDMDLVEVKVKYGWNDFSFYEKLPKAQDLLKDLNCKGKIYKFCKHVLKQTLPSYGGECKISDFYMSSTFVKYMEDTFGVVNINDHSTSQKY